jgi:serine/threonine protein kinase
MVPATRGVPVICATCGEPDIEGPCPTCGADGLLNDRFVLEKILGNGAHGTTYRARERETGASVAIKELSLRPGTSRKAVELFHREAEVLRQLDHPQVPDYSDHFEAGRGKNRALYIAQEFVDGEDFAQILDGHRFTEREVLELLAELLPVFEYLHGLSPPVVHRDVKPRNVMRRREDGRVFLVDFGTVRDALQDPDMGGSTVAGTFGYMAPEQFAGDAEPASDLYGLAAFAVALLTRREPHTLLGPTNRLDWTPHTRVSPGVEAFLRSLLEPDPQERLGSARVATVAVARLLRNERNTPAPPKPQLPARHPDRLPSPDTSGREVLWSQQFTRSIPGTLPPEHFDLVVAAIENAMGLTGRVSVVGKSLRWHAAHPNRIVSVSLEPRGDQSIIRGREQLGQLAGGLFGGIGGGVGGGLGGGLSYPAYMVGGPTAVLAWLILVVGGALLLAWVIYDNVRRSRGEALQRVLAEVAEVVEGFAGE